MYLLVSTKQCVCVGELSAISPLLMVGFVLSDGESTCQSKVCWSCGQGDPSSISHHHQCLTLEHLPVYSLLVLWSRWSFVKQSSPQVWLAYLPVYSLLVLWSRWSFVKQSSPQVWLVYLPVYSLLVLWSRWSFVNQSSPPVPDSGAPAGL